MDPTQASWWWQYGLDGVIGGLVGGAATGLAVWLTIRHERREADRTAVLAAAAAVQARALRLAGNLAAGRGTLDDWMAAIWDVQALALELNARASRRWPKFASQIAEHANAMTDVSQLSTKPVLDRRDDMVAAASNIAAVAVMWISNPKTGR